MKRAVIESGSRPGGKGRKVSTAKRFDAIAKAIGKAADPDTISGKESSTEPGKPWLELTFDLGGVPYRASVRPLDMSVPMPAARARDEESSRARKRRELEEGIRESGEGAHPLER